MITDEEIKIIEEVCKNLNEHECNKRGINEKKLECRYCYLYWGYSKVKDDPFIAYNLYRCIKNNKIINFYNVDENELYSISWNNHLFKCFYDSLLDLLNNHNFNEIFNLINKDYDIFLSNKVFYSNDYTIEQYKEKIFDIIKNIYEKTIIKSEKNTCVKIFKEKFRDLCEENIIKYYLKQEFNHDNFQNVIDICNEFYRNKELSNIIQDIYDAYDFGSFINMNEFVQHYKEYVNWSSSGWHSSNYNDLINNHVAIIIFNNTNYTGLDLNFINELLDCNSSLSYKINNQKLIDKKVLSEERDYTFNESKNFYLIFVKHIPVIINEIVDKLKIKDLDNKIIDKLKSINIVFSNRKSEDIYPGEELIIPDIIKLIQKILELLNKKENSSEKEFLLHILNRLLEQLGSRFVDGKRIESAINEFLNTIFNEERNIDFNDLDDDISTLLKDLIKIFQNRPHKQITLGLFHSKEFKITLFLNSIRNCAIEDNVKPEDYALEVFAHEMFHAFHYLIVNNDAEWNKKDNKIIIESFASYFEHLFINRINEMNENGIYRISDIYNNKKSYSSFHSCSSNKSLNACSLINSWKNNSINNWPYSGAKYMNLVYESNYYRICFSKNNMFRYLFNLSINDLTKANNKLKEIDSILNI